ncbi:Uncharacterised protein [Bordetella pertussis]|nr:Uncharacterised protein [Bordetella pertussis]CFP65241.1 Uncharacterised protein [Bordetella pertussis]
MPVHSSIDGKVFPEIGVSPRGCRPDTVGSASRAAWLRQAHVFLAIRRELL